jgi:lipopolysaccharide export system permease protein
MRMTLLSRYLFKQFIPPFFASYAGICTMILVTHIFERMNAFIEGKAALGAVAGYLSTMMPLQCLEALPIAVLMAILFVLGALQRSNEIVAMTTGGIPPEKCFGVFFATGLALSLLGMLAHETFIPRATHYSKLVYHTRINHLGEWKQVNFDNKVVSGAEGRFWYFRRLNTSSGDVMGPIVDTTQDGRLTEQAGAVSAKRVPEGWLFQKGTLRRYGNGGAELTSNEPFETRLFPYAETPDGLVPSDINSEELTFVGLETHIRRMKALGLSTRRLEVELCAKLALPLASFVVICLGIPLALVRRTSRVRAVVTTLVLSFFYLGLVQFGKALAQNWVSPWVGAWLANGACLTLGAVLWFRRRVMV